MSLSVSPSTPLDSYDAQQADSQGFVPDGAEMIRTERSKYIPAYFLPSIFASVVSYAVGGLPILNDFAWIGIIIASATVLIAEFRAFSFRWGLGGLVCSAGILVWLCYDYMTTWSIFFGQARGVSLDLVTDTVLARATLAHSLFVPCLFLGMRIRLGGWIDRRIASLAGPRSTAMWMAVILFAVFFGFSPYFIFTRGNPFLQIWNDMWAGRAGTGAQWVTGRTGNANYSWGAYIAQIQQIGTYGMILAGYYAIMVARTNLGRVGGMVLWLPAALQGFGSGARSGFIAVALPLIGFLFVRLQANAAARGRRISVAGIGWLAASLFAVLVVVQIMITFRNTGFQKVDINAVNISKVEGNSMFSESLSGFKMIPDFREPFYSNFPGQTVVWAPIDTVYWFFVSPIPRALWTSKPIDPVGIWYNRLVGGNSSSNGIEGTTISQGAVGHWYFRFGWPGVLEGGLIIGFLFGIAERLLREHSHRPLAIIASLALATCVFRSFRGLAWLDYHPTIVGLIGIATITLLFRLAIPDRPQQQT
jgi:hypothetical protein